jgi:hypothetical protein
MEMLYQYLLDPNHKLHSNTYNYSINFSLKFARKYFPKVVTDKLLENISSQIL